MDCSLGCSLYLVPLWFANRQPINYSTWRMLKLTLIFIKRTTWNFGTVRVMQAV
jgi:hypothetical protein